MMKKIYLKVTEDFLDNEAMKELQKKKKSSIRLKKSVRKVLHKVKS